MLYELFKSTYIIQCGCQSKCGVTNYYNGMTNYSMTNFLNNNFEKKSLNSDGQRFHKYQHKRTMISHLKLLNSKTSTTYGLGNPGPVCGQTKMWR